MIMGLLLSPDVTRIIRDVLVGRLQLHSTTCSCGRCEDGRAILSRYDILASLVDEVHDLAKQNDQLRMLCQFQQEQIDLLNTMCPVPEIPDRFDATDILEP